MTLTTTFALAPLVTLSLAACAVGPQQYRIQTAAAPDATYHCAQSLVDSLGYTVRGSDQAGGFLSVEKQYRGLEFHYDMLTLSVLKADDGRTELHVTAQTDALSSTGERGPTIRSNQVMSDANLVLTRCGLA